MQSHSNICCKLVLKKSLWIMRKGSQIFLCDSWSLLDFVRFGFVFASNFKWFLGDFGWLLLVESDFGWFQVVGCLVVTPISQHAEKLTLYCTHGRTWLNEVFDFFIQSKTGRKSLLLPCRLILSPSRLKISDYFLYSIVFYARKKTSFKANFSNKQLQNTERVEVLRNIWDKEFWLGASQKISKTGGLLFSLTGRWGEMKQNGEISPSDGERRQVCRIIQCGGFCGLVNSV